MNVCLNYHSVICFVQAYDATVLAASYSGPDLDILIDQGRDDQFLSASQLLPDNLIAACSEKKIPVVFRLQQVSRAPFKKNINYTIIYWHPSGNTPSLVTYNWTHPNQTQAFSLTFSLVDVLQSYPQPISPPFSPLCSRDQRCLLTALWHFLAWWYWWYYSRGPVDWKCAVVPLLVECTQVWLNWGSPNIHSNRMCIIEIHKAICNKLI